MEECLKKTPDGLASKDHEVGSVDSDSSRAEMHEELEHISLVVGDMDKENGMPSIVLNENLPPQSALITSDRNSELDDVSSAHYDLKRSSDISSECSRETSLVDSADIGFFEDPEAGNIGAEYESDLKEPSDSASTDILLEESLDFPGISSVVDTVTPEVSPPTTPIQREEDVSTESWRIKRRHVFVLSEAGKPIYSRYGNEEALSSTMGVMMALVSFVQSGDNSIRSIHSGR